SAAKISSGFFIVNEPAMGHPGLLGNPKPDIIATECRSSPLPSQQTSGLGTKLASLITPFWHLLLDGEADSHCYHQLRYRRRSWVGAACMVLRHPFANSVCAAAGGRMVTWGCDDERSFLTGTRAGGYRRGTAATRAKHCHISANLRPDECRSAWTA